MGCSVNYLLKIKAIYIPESRQFRYICKVEKI